METREKYRIDHLLAAFLLFVMALIAFVNVLSRHLFHFSLAASEEITINLFVWLTVIGSGLAFERGGQLGMATVFNLFPQRLKKAASILSAGLSALLFVLVNIFMIQAIWDELTFFHAKSGALGLPIWLYYSGVPVMSIFVFRGIYRGAAAKLREIEDGA
ncbi:MAG: TRAP transporter small permease subunit [Pseudomonadota bacterium]